MKITKFYHASPRRFRHGDILTGGHTGGWGTEHPNVCMTDSPMPHATIKSKAIEENWFVYEVEPMYRVWHCDSNCEFQTRAARIIRCVGSAVGISCNNKPGYSYVHIYPRRGVKCHPYRKYYTYSNGYR